MAGAFLLLAPIILGQEALPTPQPADRSGVTIEEVKRRTWYVAVKKRF